MTWDDVELAELIADTCDEPELQAVVQVFVGDRIVWVRTPEGVKEQQRTITFPYEKIPTVRALLPARWNGGAGARFEFRVRPNPR